MLSKTDSDSDSDYFDFLPDALLLLIFNRVQDAKSLTNCLLVSKRFSSLVPFTTTIFISIPPPQKHLSSKPYTAGSCSGSYMHTLRLLLHSFFLKPLKCFHQILDPKSESASCGSFESSCYLKNFNRIKSLHLQLPANGNELGSNCGASFLKWKADFGSNLKTCIIFGATSFQKCNTKFSSSSNTLKEQESMEQILTDDELKLRIIWIISCLIAASTRHYLLKQILAVHPIPMLETVVVSDENKQGKLYMGKEELAEMRDPLNSEQEGNPEPSALQRTRVPELSMKLWYLPLLELPESGYVMRGASVIHVKPIDEMVETKNNGDLVTERLELDGDHGKAFSEAVVEMVKVKKSYLMTMSSF